MQQVEKRTECPQGILCPASMFAISGLLASLSLPLRQISPLAVDSTPRRARSIKIDGRFVDGRSANQLSPQLPLRCCLLLRALSDDSCRRPITSQSRSRVVCRRLLSSARVIAIINIIIRSQFDHGAPQDQSAHPTVDSSYTDFTRDGFSDKSMTKLSSYHCHLCLLKKRYIYQLIPSVPPPKVPLPQELLIPPCIVNRVSRQQ